ncbi:MAG: FecR family protein [Saccharospirillum sp.]|nr:FecR family protein [Saccharospirillum sp.]
MIRVCLFAMSLILISTQALSSVGKIIIASGDVYALDANNTARELRRRSDVFEGDTLVTGTDGSLQIRFNDNAILALQEDSRLVISAYQSAGSDREERVLMDLLAGGFRTITGSIGRTDRDTYQVRTPNASIGIRGTHFELLQTIDALLIGVYEGNIRVSNASGQLNLGQQEAYLFARVMHQRRPEGLLQPPPELMRPRTSRFAPPSEEDEEATWLTDSDADSLPLNRLFQASDPNLPPQQPLGAERDEVPSYLLALLEESPETALVMAEPIISGPESGDYRLSQAQVDEFSDTPRTGFVVLTDENGNPVHFVYLASGDNGPVFANFESELLTELNDGYKVPDYVFKGPESVSPVELATFNLGDEVIYWGRWDASPEDQAKLYSDPDSTDVSRMVESSFFFVEATPASDLPLSGSLDFSLNCTNDPCLVTSRPLYESDGINFIYGGLNIDLDSGDGSGYLDITTQNLRDAAASDNWYLYFSGSLVGSQFFSLVEGDGESMVYIDGADAQFLSGNVDGLIVHDGSQFHVTGGFGVSTDDNAHSLSGIFLMEQSGSDGSVTGQ